MNPRRFHRCLTWLVLSILPSAGFGDPTPADPINSMLAGAAYEIGPGDDGIRAPLVLHEGIAPADLDPNAPVVDAALGTQRSEALQKSFQASVDPQGALVVKVIGGPLRQGTYDVKVQVRMKVAKAGFKAAQALDFRITQPAAQLRAPDTLVIEQVIGILEPPQTKTPPLLLTETSGKSRLKGIKIQQIDNPAGLSGDGQPVLTFDQAPEIPQGETASATYRFQVVSNPPLGSVQGHAQVTSPQLAAPVPLTFEIRTRRTASWILVIAGLGLVCGLLLRTLLPQLVSLDQTRVQGLDALVGIDRETAHRKDGTFRSHAQTIRQELEGKVQQRPPLAAEDLTKAITAATDALNKEIADLTVRIAAAQQEVDRLGRLVETPWLLPEELDTARGKARQDLGDARSALLESDAQAAGDAQRSAQQNLAPLAGLIRDWPITLEEILDALDSTALPVPDFMQARFKEAVKRVRSLLDELSDPGVTPGFEALSQVLEAVHKARTGARQLLLRIKPGIETTLDDVEAALRPISPPGVEPPLRGVRAQADAWLRDLAAAAAVPETATPAVQALFAGLDAALKPLLLGLAPPGDGRKAVEGKLDQQAYADAAREVARQAQAARVAAAQAPEEEGAMLGNLLVVEKEEEVPSPSLWTGLERLRLELPSWTAPRLPFDLSPGGLAATRAGILQELGWVTGLRTGLTWIGLLWLAFLLFHDKAGTLQDYAEVFFWGFGTDVTVDAFWNAAKGYKKT